MFKKKLSIRSSKSSNFDSSPLDEPFWHWYLDSFARIEIYNGDPIPYNNKKYHHNSKDVVLIKKFFEERKFPIPMDYEVMALLKSPFTQGDLKETCCLIRFFQLSGQGLFLTNKDYDRFGNKIELQGAENWDNVMCYFDSLIFAMFSNLESFEPILFISNQHENYLVNQLATLLRLYVSLLRAGKLITTDITIRICEILLKLGFQEAMSSRQQDASILFEFLTETLSMPLLTFKIDIKHGGKYNKDDDLKYSKERILFVSLPEEDDEEEKEGSEKTDHDPTNPETKDNGGNEVLLEECLEHYFNNSINVKRELERRATLQSITRDLPGGEVNYLPELSEGKVSENIASNPTSENKSDLTKENADNQSSKINIPTSPKTINESQFPTSNATGASYAPTIGSKSSLSKANTKYSIRARSSTLSIWSLDENEIDGKPREVLLPAWMFLRLLPFYTDDNNIMDNKNESIAKNSREFINRRPILPICLKRYSFDKGNSKANRSSKRIIIPPVINLPQFVEDDSQDDMAGNFKLILESAICHRGNSISSGHFVSVVRKYKMDIDEGEEAYDATWYLYDDMKKKARVVEKSFKEIFSVEWPYMLFYRLVAMDEYHKGYNSSPGSSISYNSKAKPFIVAEGSNNKFWVDNTLSPVISNEDASSIAGENESKSDEISVTAPDVPTSIDLSLNESKLVDIRNKYYWYIIDKDKNYYKEYPDLTKIGTGESAVSISPQFRRNSQWSEKSASYTQLLNESQNSPNVANDLNYNVSLNSSKSSVSAIKKSFKLKKNSHNNGTSTEKQDESALESKRTVSSKTSTELKHEELSNGNGKEKSNNINKKEKKHDKHHRHSLRREKYKKEKCILM